MNSKERFEKIKEQYNKSNKYALYISYDDIGFLLNQLTKQEKIIDLMAKEFSKTVCFAPLNQKCNQGDKNFDKFKCIECIKQYFEKKAEESE